jgi:hypothetical protein
MCAATMCRPFNSTQVWGKGVRLALKRRSRHELKGLMRCEVGSMITRSSKLMLLAGIALFYRSLY